MPDKNRIKLRVEAGTDKRGKQEGFGTVEFHSGQVIALVGPTGSGKTRFLADVERLSAGDSPTRRRITLTGVPKELVSAGHAVARISQSMQFFLDLTARGFIDMHISARGRRPEPDVSSVIGWANHLAGEPIDPDQPLAALSGGQARALMVADMVLVSDSPVLLIDEIENAGIDRYAALSFLLSKDRLVFVATHDPLIALRSGHRLVLGEGAIRQVLETTPGERKRAQQLARTERRVAAMRDQLRSGEVLE